MRAEVICEIKSLTFPSSARARSGLRISQCSPFLSSSISPAGVFNVTRRTCAAVTSVSFLSRNSSGFLSISFLTDCVARNVSFEFWKRTYILPSNAASYFNLLIAILNDDAVDFASVEIDNVLGLPSCLLRARPLHFKEPEVSDASERDDRQDEGIPPLHTKRGAATIPSFRSTLAPAV